MGRHRLHAEEGQVGAVFHAQIDERAEAAALRRCLSSGRTDSPRAWSRSRTDAGAGHERVEASCGWARRAPPPVRRRGRWRAPAAPSWRSARRRRSRCARPVAIASRSTCVVELDAIRPRRCRARCAYSPNTMPRFSQAPARSASGRLVGVREHDAQLLITRSALSASAGRGCRRRRGAEARRRAPVPSAPAAAYQIDVHDARFDAR